MAWLAYPVKEQIRITDMYSMFEVHYDKGYAFPGELHNFWECVYIMKGEACVSGNERVYNLSQGSIIFHKPLELHKFSINGEGGADLLIFSFAAEGPLTSWLGEKVFRLSDFQLKIVGDMLSFIREKRKEEPFSEGEIFPLPKSPYQNYLRAFRYSPVYSQMLAVYLQQLMLSLAETGDITEVSDAPDAEVFRRAISYLNGNIHRQPSVPELARFCNISEAGMKRLFEKYAGIGIHKYLLKRKMTAAIELLRRGERVSDVAEKLGFNSQSYFSRAFKRETGFMPSELDGKERPRKEN